MRFDIITIFPKIFDSYINESILKRAQKNKLISIKIHPLRNPKKEKRKILDDTPYGGGAGMVLKAEPILRAIQKIAKRKKRKIIILSAKGKQFNQKYAINLSKKYNQIIMVSGRYEGIDERVKKILSDKTESGILGKVEEISIGPYVLTDGDVAASVIVSAVARLVPKVINAKSLKEESHFNFLKQSEIEISKKGFEYPHYTKPEILVWKNKKYRVPKVLLSGNHKKIKEWREKCSK